MWSRLSSPGSWSLPVLAVCAACCCKALLPLWNLGVDREHLGPGRASSLLGPHMYTQGGRDGGGRAREVERSFRFVHCISLCILSNLPMPTDLPTYLSPSMSPSSFQHTHLRVVCFMNGCFDGCFFHLSLL